MTVDAAAGSEAASPGTALPWWRRSLDLVLGRGVTGWGAAVWGAAGSPYWLTRFLILRLLGLVYFVAFLSLARQVLPLVGHRGLLPADLFLARIEEHFGSRLGGFLEFLGLFWACLSDGALLALAWTGAVLSFVVL